ncbi:hypothetical protein [Streptosporangium subroseum]|uniref:hypothetical protein n=1 Tax=Streptosporangium subroseum TaxID=106412 RepID=UPI0030935873|nr:hypothetical protein OHB15_23320 [Streptosporangium subroseum]
MLLPSILLGAGAGVTFAPVTAVIMHQAPSEHIGAATGGLNRGLGTTLLATAAFPGTPPSPTWSQTRQTVPGTRC